MLNDLSFVIGLVVKLVSAWFLAVGAFALFRRKRFARRKPATRFAVIVAARNEEAVIGGLVESLRRQDYPDELYDIYVVPNNCTDATAQAARDAGAVVMTCARPVGCKGDVLHQAFEWLLFERPDYDAFLVFDADNRAQPGYLAAMNDAVVSGARAVKGRLSAANPYDSWVTGCYAIYFEMFHLMYNRARMACGLSAKLVGTGFCVHRDLLLEIEGWNTRTIAEDAEFAAILAGMGERVYYQPDAVSLDMQPRSFSLSLIQRRRWCSGIMQAGTLAMPFLRRTALRGNLFAFDTAMFFLSPYAQLLALLPPLLGGLAYALSPTAPALLLSGIAWTLVISYLGAVGIACAVALLSRAWDLRILKGIFTYPIFMASWIPLQVAAFFFPTNVWRPIAHTASPVARQAG